MNNEMNIGRIGFGPGQAAPLGPQPGQWIRGAALDDERKCFIVMWKFGDHSGFGIVGVYQRKAVAESLLETLKEYGDRQFWLEEQEIK